MSHKTFVSGFRRLVLTYFAFVLLSCQSSRLSGKALAESASGTTPQRENADGDEGSNPTTLRRLEPNFSGLAVDEHFLWLESPHKIQKLSLPDLRLQTEIALAGKVSGWTVRADGKELALIEEVKDALFLRFLDSSGKELQKIRFRDNRRRWDPTLSPDGQWILYAADQGRSPAEVWIEGVNRKTERSFKFVSQAGESTSPRFHPLHKQIVWTTLRPQRRDLSDLFVATWEIQDKQLKFSNAQQLTQEFWGLHVTPHWLGTQEKLVWASNAESHGRLQLFVYDLSKKCIQKIPGTADNKWMPLTSLDAQFLYWLSPTSKGDSELVRSAWVAPSTPCLTSNLQGDRRLRRNAR